MDLFMMEILIMVSDQVMGNGSRAKYRLSTMSTKGNMIKTRKMDMANISGQMGLNMKDSSKTT